MFYPLAFHAAPCCSMLLMLLHASYFMLYAANAFHKLPLIELRSGWYSICMNPFRNPKCPILPSTRWQGLQHMRAALSRLQALSLLSLTLRGVLDSFRWLTLLAAILYGLNLPTLIRVEDISGHPLCAQYAFHAHLWEDTSLHDCLRVWERATRARQPKAPHHTHESQDICDEYSSSAELEVKIEECHRLHVERARLGGEVHAATHMPCGCRVELENQGGKHDVHLCDFVWL